MWEILAKGGSILYLLLIAFFVVYIILNILGADTTPEIMRTLPWEIGH